MRGLRKTAFWLGLFGSVSLLPLSVMAEDASVSQPDNPHPVLADSPAEPSFHDVATLEAPAGKDLGPPAIPLPEPAPVSLEAADLKPAPSIDIPLPDAAPVTALMQADLFRMAVEESSRTRLPCASCASAAGTGRRFPPSTRRPSVRWPGRRMASGLRQPAR
ncbi:hypothetical protein ACFQY9_05025 [Microvirga aerilata]|uniref:hypothetical protein n=1 Tax=Microvirga aerilata TaxID=670292 RepID=UPI0036456721